MRISRIQTLDASFKDWIYDDDYENLREALQHNMFLEVTKETSTMLVTIADITAVFVDNAEINVD